MTANGGFFLTNLFSFLNPTPLSIQTPPELQAYGWTTADVWCAPTATALYALLTHAQPFWAELHSVLAQVLGASEPVKPLNPEYARAVCASLLGSLFVGRTVKNFGLWKKAVPVKGSISIRWLILYDSHNVFQNQKRKFNKYNKCPRMTLLARLLFSLLRISSRIHERTSFE